MYYYALPLLIVLTVLIVLIVLIVLLIVLLISWGGGRPHPRLILQCNVELFSCTTILHTSQSYL